MTSLTQAARPRAYLRCMVVTFFLLGTAIIALAAIAGGAASQSLQHHHDEIGGDFGTASLPGGEAEIRALIAGGRR